MKRYTRDLRDVGRRLWRMRTITALAVVTLALAIGLNAGAFSLVNALMWRTLPVLAPEELVAVSMIDRSGDIRHLSLPMFLELDRRQSVFTETIAWVGDLVLNVEAGDEVGLGNVWAVSENFLTTLGQAPAVGRVLGPSDMSLTAGVGSDVVVLGYGFWQRRFAGAPNVLGNTVRIEGRSLTVIGVAPEWFSGMSLGIAPDVIIPLTALPEINRALGQTQDLHDRSWLALRVAGRLKEGVAIAQAQAQLSGLWPELMDALTPADITGVQRDEFLAVRVRVESAARGVDRDARATFVRPLYAVIGLGILLFIVACLHLANVMLAYALRREQDLAVRVALGASRSGLVRQALTETLVVVVFSAGVGLVVARWIGLALAEFMSQNGALPLLVDLDPDLHVFALVTGCGALACIVCSSGTVWLTLRHDPARILQRHLSTITPSIGWSAKTLLTAQVAISLVLLVSSASLVQYLRSVRTSDPGFLGDGLLVARLYPRPLGYANIDDNAYYPALIERLSAQEGIAHAALVNYEPAGGFEFAQVVERPAMERDPQPTSAAFSVVSPGFFATIGMTTTQGRDLRWDDTASRPRVVVITSNLAERLFPSADAVGQYIRIGSEPERRRVQVVGVVQNARLFDLRQPEPFIAFVPWLQEPEYTHWAGRIVVRSSDDMRAASGIRMTLDGLGREYPMWIRTLTDVANRALLQERLAARLAGAFALFAICLTAVGLYGLLSNLVVRRTREIGIRLALGATGGDVIFCLIRSSLVLVAVGVALGLGGIFFSSSLLQRLFRGVGMPAWSVFIGIAALTTVSLIAMYLPARRASLMPPTTALRQE